MSKKQFINIHNFDEGYIGFPALPNEPTSVYDCVAKKFITTNSVNYNAELINTLFSKAAAYEIIDDQYVQVRCNLYDVGNPASGNQPCAIFLQNNSKIYIVEYSYYVYTTSDTIYLAKGFIKAFVGLLFSSLYPEIISYSITTQRYL